MVNDSRITRLTFHEVVVPCHPGAISSPQIDKPLHMLPSGGSTGWSIQFDELPKLILRLELTGGIVGWGELYRDHDWHRIHAICDTLLGQDIRNLTLSALPIPECREYDGFELAIWDAYARLIGVPLHRLLGGKRRDNVRVGAWSSHRTMDEVGETAARFQEQGFDCIKFKCDLEDDVAGWCREIAKHAPGMDVILDPNQRWDGTGETRKRLRALEVIGNVLCLEDPIPRWQLNDYAALRNFSAVPIVRHVSLPYVSMGQRVHDAINALTHNAVDGFNFNGGLARFQQLSQIAGAAEIKCWHGSEVDLGILEASYIHKAAAAETCVWPSDIFGRLIRSHDLLAAPLAIDPPYAAVPDGPGLGVEPDPKAIESHQIDRKDFAL